MTQKNLLAAAGVTLLVIGLMKINEPTARTLDFNGVLNFWAPLLVGGFAVYTVFLAKA